MRRIALLVLFAPVAVLAFLLWCLLRLAEQMDRAESGYLTLG